MPAHIRHETTDGGEHASELAQETMREALECQLNWSDTEPAPE